MMGPLSVITLRQPTVMDRVSRAVAIVTLAMLTAMMLGFVTTIAYPWNPITKIDIIVLGMPIAGRNLTVQIDYCKVRDWAPESVRWSLMNDVTVVLPVLTASLPTGCQVKRLSIPIPEHVAPGDYRLQEELVYRPWPWRSFTYVRQSPMFTLAPAR